MSFSRNERPILELAALLLGQQRSRAHPARHQTTGDVDVDTSLSRFDVSPQIRYPFKRWQWFTVNSTLSWRDTYYTRSYAPTDDPTVAPSKVIDDDLNRPVFIFQAQIVGPVFNRVWDTPDNGYAEKFKHIDRAVRDACSAPRRSTTSIASSTSTASISTSAARTLTYGLNNRFYAKRKLAPGAPARRARSSAVESAQTYYTDQRAAQYDPQYSDHRPTTPPSHFSADVV